MIRWLLIITLVIVAFVGGCSIHSTPAHGDGHVISQTWVNSQHVEIIDVDFGGRTHRCAITSSGGVWCEP